MCKYNYFIAIVHYSAFIQMVYSPAITPGSKDVVSMGAFAGEENFTTSMLHIYSVSDFFNMHANFNIIS